MEKRIETINLVAESKNMNDNGTLSIIMEEPFERNLYEFDELNYEYLAITHVGYMFKNMIKELDRRLNTEGIDSDYGFHVRMNNMLRAYSMMVAHANTPISANDTYTKGEYPSLRNFRADLEVEFKIGIMNDNPIIMAANLKENGNLVVSCDDWYDRSSLKKHIRPIELNLDKLKDIIRKHCDNIKERCN